MQYSCFCLLTFASLQCATDYRLPFATPTFVLADISDYPLYFPPSSNVLHMYTSPQRFLFQSLAQGVIVVTLVDRIMSLEFEYGPPTRIEGPDSAPTA